ncbi:cholinesterase 1-like [Euwallacea similis]|uniref:cholinesterase 1-like n=1 Tax=Euwallacea similis TaxID=1736056 RepID=UPI00344B1B95
MEWDIGPHYLMKCRVIMIAFNYSIGPVGWILLKTENYRFNLKFLNHLTTEDDKNIEYFEGDPEKVIIFGQSTGAASVSYLLLNPLAEDSILGLSRATILEGGSALDLWAYQRDQVEITDQTVALLNSDFETYKKRYEIAEVPAKLVLLRTFLETSNSPRGFITPQSLSSNMKMRFDFIASLLAVFEFEEFVKIPLLIGLNAQKSVFIVYSAMPNLVDAYDKDPSVMVLLDTHVEDKKVLQEMGQKIKDFYSAKMKIYPKIY